MSKKPPPDPNRVVLRVSHIWRDEVMADEVFMEDQTITLGTTGDDTFTTGEVGLPNNFTIFRPGSRGYVVTLASTMSGELELDRQKHEIQSFVKGMADGEYKSSTISEGDFGVIELGGEHSLFFQFVKAGRPLPTAPWLRDAELLLPAFAFAVLLIGSFLTYALAFATHNDNPFLSPGRRELVANYLLTRPLEEVKEEVVISVDKGGDTKKDPAATKGKTGKSGGKGDKERKRVERPDHGDPDEPLPTKIRVGANSDRSRAVIAKVNNLGGIDKRLNDTMAGLEGPSNNGALAGNGTGSGTGVGSSKNGRGTRGSGSGNGGGGTSHADSKGQGKFNTGGTRKGTGGGDGDGPKEVKVKVKLNKPGGSLGGLTQEQILKVVRRRQRAIQSCYSRQLQRNKGLSGKVTISWKIDSKGKVSRVKVRSTTLKNGAVEDCIGREIQRMTFPTPKGGSSANVNFPFIFTQN